MGKYTNDLNNQLKKAHPGYERQLYQTYFTAPEWRNVEMAQELGKFLKDGNAFYRFPYFRQIRTLWNVIIDSYKASKKYHTHKQILTSEYMAMNLFVGVFTTGGFLALGTLSLILSPFMKAKNKTPLQKYVADIVSEYGNDLRTIPFYNYPYLSKLKPMWRVFLDSNNKTFADVVTLLTASAQLVVRRIVSAPVGWIYNDPQYQSAEKIHVLVKSKSNPDELKRVDSKIELLDKQTKNNKHGETVHYTHITTPRYEAFGEIVKQFVAQDIKIQKIAGQDRIQFKLHTDDTKDEKLKDFNVLYSYQNDLDKKKTVFIDVETKQLSDTVKDLAQNEIQLKFMHDF